MSESHQHSHHVAEKIGAAFGKAVDKTVEAVEAVTHPVEAFEKHQEKKDLKEQLSKGTTMLRQQHTTWSDQPSSGEEPARTAPFGQPTEGVYHVPGTVGTLGASTTIEVSGIDWHGIKAGDHEGTPYWDVVAGECALVGTKADIAQWLSDNADGYLANGKLSLPQSERSITDKDHDLWDTSTEKVNVYVEASRFRPGSKQRRFTTINPVTATAKMLASRIASAAAEPAMEGNVATTISDYVGAVQDAKDTVKGGESSEIHADEALYIVTFSNGGGGVTLGCEPVKKLGGLQAVKVSAAKDTILGVLDSV